MIPVERQQQILHLLAERGAVSITELTERLQVSHLTIRRDIQKLEEQGRVLSVSGGVSLSERIKSEPSHATKRSLMQEAKLAIAHSAAAQVAAGSSVYLDAGTTSLELARDYCTRLIGMKAGRVVFDGAPEHLTDDIVIDLYGIEANDVLDLPEAAARQLNGSTALPSAA